MQKIEKTMMTTTITKVLMVESPSQRGHREPPLGDRLTLLRFIFLYFFDPAVQCLSLEIQAQLWNPPIDDIWRPCPPRQGGGLDYEHCVLTISALARCETWLSYLAKEGHFSSQAPRCLLLSKAGGWSCDEEGEKGWGEKTRELWSNRRSKTK